MPARTVLLNLIGNDRVSRVMRGVSRELSNAADETSRLSTAMDGLNKVGRGGGMAAAAAGALALTKAATPAAAAIAALPAAMAAAKIASGTLKVGLVGVGDAMSAVAEGDASALNEALRKLSPNARAFVRQANAMRGEVVGLQRAVQDRLFQGLDKQLGVLGKNLLPTARKGMVDVAGGLNGIATQATKTASTPWFRGQVNRVFAQTSNIMTVLQGAVGPVLNSVARLTVAGTPLVVRMTQWTVQAIKSASAWLAVRQESGQLARVITAVGNAFARIGSIGANVIRAVMGIVGSAGAFNSAGSDVLATLERLTGQFAAWVNSADGQQRLANAFQVLGDAARQVVQVLPLLLGPLALVAKTVLGMPEPVRNLVSQMLAWSIIIGVVGTRLKLLTGITATWTVVTKGASAAVAVATFQVGRYSAASLTAAAATRGWSAAMGLLALTSFGRGFANVNAAMAANATLSTRLGAALRSQIMLWRQQAAATGVSTARIIINAAVQRAVAVATRAWAAAQWVLNAALNANPIGLVIAAIALLAGGIYLLWTRSSTFRAIVMAAWAGIKTAIAAAWSFIQPVFTAIKNWLVVTLGPAMRWLWTTAQTVWSAILNAIRVAWSFISPIFNAIATVVRTVLGVVWTVLLNAVKIAWIAIQLNIKATWFVIKGIFTAIKWFVVSVLAPVFKWLWSTVIKPVWAGISAAIRVAWAVIKTIFGAIKTGVNATLAPIFRWLWNSVIKPVWGGIKSTIQNVWNSGIKPTFELLKRGVQAIKGAFSSAVNGIKGVWDRLKNIAKTPVNFVLRLYNDGLVGLVNGIASVAGIKTRLSKLPMFSRGGVLPGYSPGVDSLIAAVSPGESIFRPEFTRAVGGGWVAAANDAARRSGVEGVRRWLTGPGAIGGEGLAFSRGGVVPRFAGGFALGGIIGDFVQGVRDFSISNIGKAASSLLDKVLSNVPGSGMFRDVINAIPAWIKDTVLKWIKGKVEGGGVGGAGVQRALAFARAQVGKPYTWGGVGPGGFDCSGFMSALTNVIQGKSPYQRRFTTFSFNGGASGPAGFQRNLRSGFQVGITNSGVGHMAGTLGGTNVESSGSVGPHMGPSARGAGDGLFSMRYGLKFARGGVVPQVRTATYDSGGWLMPGYTLAFNGTGKPEPVFARGGVVAKARSKAGSSLLSGFGSTTWRDASKIGAWFSKLIASIKKQFSGGREKSLLKWASGVQKALNSAATKAASIASQISAAKEYASGVASSAREFGALSNLTNKSSAYNVGVGLQDRAKQLTSFATQITGLKKRGLNANLLRQIIDMGAGEGSSVAAALLAGNGTDFKRINSAQAAIDKAATGLGNAAANALYDSGASAGRGFLSGLYAQQSSLNKLMDSLGRRLADGVRKSFGVKTKPKTKLSLGSKKGVTKYDSGGMLMPGLTVAYNATRRPEPVLTSQQFAELTAAPGERSGPVIEALHVHHVPGYSTPQDITRAMRHAELVARTHRRR